MERNVRYARNGDVQIAYTVAGDGPRDLVYVPGIWSNIDLMWEEPHLARFLDRLASFSRLIVFDMRGIGLSDRGQEPPVVELQSDDIRAVMDETGARSAAVFGVARGAAAAALFAASHPDRTEALILYGSLVRTLWAPDFPWGWSQERSDAFYERWVRELGTGENLDLQSPTGYADEAFKRWWARFERLVATPQSFRELGAILRLIDVRSVLPHIQAPTLVMHRTGDRIPDVGQSRYLAEHVPGARLVELPGADHLPFMGDQDAILDEIEEFLTGARQAIPTDRVLATVQFTDIVGSTESLARLGDRAWRDMLVAHRAVVRRQLAAYRGVELDTAGDGFMARFDGPARAIQCAAAIIRESRGLGVQVRGGVHTGECQVIGDGLAGIAVHIAARVSALANPDEVLVTGTVRELVAGSGIEFEDRGIHQLKGVPDPWHLYAAAES